MTGIREGIRRLTDRLDARAAVILLSASVALTVYKCYGSSEFFDRSLLHLLRVGRSAPFYSTVYSFVSCFLLMFILPVVVIKVFLKKRVREFGFQIGDAQAALAVTAVLFPLIALLLLLPASKLPAFRNEYPLFQKAGETLGLFVLYEVLYGFYYLAWEFFFRGYMLFGLKDSLGAANSILIQTIPSVLMHIGKPDAEIFMSIIAGVVFGVIALRTRSIVFVFLLHWFIGIALDILIVLG